MSRKKVEAEMGISLKPLMETNKFLGFVGRCWGREKTNPFQGSHVTLGRGKEMISVHVIKDKKGWKVNIHECVKTKRTTLGEEVRKIIKQAGLEIANP